jgi:carbonic anhydrase/acetyltransferase-like protein (isoleucine patch superfamily)
VLHHAVIGTGAMVAAGAVVTNGMYVPPGALAVGTPASIRPGAAHRDLIVDGVDVYVRNARRYRTQLRAVE